MNSIWFTYGILSLIRFSKNGCWGEWHATFFYWTDPLGGSRASNGKINNEN